MTVAEVMTPEIATVEADASVAQAAAIMKERDIGLLPVVAAGKVVGAISDRDIIVQAVAVGLDPHRTRVGKVMSVGAIWCRVDDLVEEAARVMAERRVHRLIVVDLENRPMGMLSVSDLATRLEDKSVAGEVLAEVSSQLAPM